VSAIGRERVQITSGGALVGALEERVSRNVN
jgi:hypothetical protein